ncbi:MAG: hypothetical protein HY646_05945 [Acidobacteria bacterium]|nr:hypothetical protein [Acidobacteriota bacterium]
MRTRLPFFTIVRFLFLCCFLEETGFGEARLIFPQIADGGGYRTVLLLTNRTASATAATISFTSSTGNPLTVTLDDGRAGTSFQVALPAGGAVKVQTAGVGNTVNVGFAEVLTAPATDMSGNAVFQLFNGRTLFSEASVPAAPPASCGHFFVDESGGFNTGFAVANSSTIPATGRVTVWNTQGTVIGQQSISIPPKQHMSRFLSQLIPSVVSGRAEVEMTSGTVSLTALRFHSSSVFSTVSVGQCFPIERFGFEDETNQGWISTTGAIGSCTPAMDRAGGGRVSLKCSVNLICSSAIKEGEVFVDLRTNPPSPEIVAPVNLEGKRMTVRAFAPAGAVGDPVRPNGFRLFVKDGNFKNFFGRFTNIEENNWMLIEATPSRSAPTGGFVDADFDPTQVLLLGFGISCGGNSQATFQGPIYIDMVSW